MLCIVQCQLFYMFTVENWIIFVNLQIFVADGEKVMRRLRIENVMVLRTDRKALYIYSESQWINVLVTVTGDTTEWKHHKN